jgi:hypothetical protein
VYGISYCVSSLIHSSSVLKLTLWSQEPISQQEGSGLASESSIRDLCWTWAMGWTIVVLGFDSQWGPGIFLFTSASRRALGPTRPPIQWVPGALSLEVKRLGREADHSPPSSAEVKNAWSYTFTPQYVFMAWCLVKHRNNFTFTRVALQQVFSSYTG